VSADEKWCEREGFRLAGLASGGARPIDLDHTFRNPLLFPIVDPHRRPRCEKDGSIDGVTHHGGCRLAAANGERPVVERHGGTDPEPGARTLPLVATRVRALRRFMFGNGRHNAMAGRQPHGLHRNTLKPYATHAAGRTVESPEAVTSREQHSRGETETACRPRNRSGVVFRGS